MRRKATTMIATMALLVAVAAFAAAPASAVLPDEWTGGGSVTASGDAQLGLTGDSPLTRVAAPEPEGLTGDSALARSQEPVATASDSDDESRWTSVMLGSGAGVVLLALLGALTLLVRQRARVVIS